MDLKQMQAEVVENTKAKGWYETDRSWGDEIALLHSEVSEALEAFRDHKLEDATAPPMISNGENPKPEGVGSELADVLIRLLDTCYRYNLIIEDKPVMAIGDFETFGSACTHLHAIISRLGEQRESQYQQEWAQSVFYTLNYITKYYNLDLEFEYHRKHAYNKTRPHRHGGRAL